jgi:hypothetical protein
VNVPTMAVPFLTATNVQSSKWRNGWVINRSSWSSNRSSTIRRTCLRHKRIPGRRATTGDHLGIPIDVVRYGSVAVTSL